MLVKRENCLSAAFFVDGEPPRCAEPARASILSVYASKSSLPGDCHVANACPARSIATSPLWLKTVTCGLFLRHFVPPRRAHNDSGVKSVRLVCYPCSGVIVSNAGDFSAVSMHGQGGEPPRANRPARVRIVPCLLQGISRLTLEMTTRTFGFKADEAVGRAGRPRPAA